MTDEITGLADTTDASTVQTTVLHTVPLSQDVRDTLLIDIHGRVSRIEEQITVLPDLEDRTRSLEKRIWQVPGASLVVAALAALGLHPHIP